MLKNGVPLQDWTEYTLSDSVDTINLGALSTSLSKYDVVRFEMRGIQARIMAYDINITPAEDLFPIVKAVLLKQDVNPADEALAESVYGNLENMDIITLLNLKQSMR